MTSDHDQSNATAAEPAIDELKRSSIGRNVAQLFGSQAITWVLSTVVAIMMPRFLGPSAVGQLRLASSLWSITQVVVGLGTATYLTLTIAKDRERGLRLVGPILVIRTIAFAVSSLVLAMVVSLSHPTTEFIAIMVLSGLGVLFAIWTDPLSAAFLGLERTGIPALAGVIGRTIGTFATVGALLLGGGAPVVVAIGTVSGLMVLAIVGMSLNRLSKITFQGWWSKTPSLLRASAAFMFSAVLLVAYREIDTVIISIFVDAAALGWYGIADQLVGSSLFIVTIVMAAVFPVLGRLHAADLPAFVNLVRRAFGSLLVAAVPIGLGIVLIAPQLVPLLYGDEFLPTADVLVVYGFVSPITFGAILFGTVAITTGRQRFWNVVMAIGIVATIPLDLVFVPWADRTYDNGAIGGAISYLVTETFMFVVGITAVCPFLLDRATAWRSARVLAAGGLMFAAAWPARDRMLLIPIAIAIVVYVTGIIAFRVVTDDERAMVGGVLARLGLHTSWSTLQRGGPEDSRD